MSYSYDVMGRVTASSQTTDGVTYPFSYAYNLAGGVETTTLPSGRSLKQCYDVAGRAKSVTGTKSGEAAHDYISQLTYDSGGGMNQAQLGNGKWEDWDYNFRKQVIGIKLGATAGASDLLSLTYGYGTTANNGNVLSQTIARPSFSVTQTYGYADPLNRLSSVTEGTESRTFDYSATGNMWVATASTNFAAGSFTPRTSTWYNASNRLVNTGLGITYDSAGNQTAIGGYTNTFDAENRLASSTINSVTTSYAYDGEGRRVKKGSMVMVYDAFGKLAAEYGGAVTSAGREYLTGDHLGSTRLVTNAAGTATKCADYLPFGEEIGQGVNGRGACYGFTDPRQKFTGKERDAETGLDYFGARYMSSVQGRFTSPDEPLVDQHASNPQSWNLYSYVRNNPLNYTDPNGRWCLFGKIGDTCNDKKIPPPPPPPTPQVPEGAPGTTTFPLLHAQDTARNSPTNQPEASGQRRTFCNFAVCQTAFAMGAPAEPLQTTVSVNGQTTTRNATANEMARNLANSSQYQEVTAEEAQTLANQGRVVIATQPAEGHGHVTTVRPTNGYLERGVERPGTGPLQNNVGRRVGVMRESRSFRASPEVRYYTPVGNTR